jgi:hypothetical protein
MNIKSQPTDAPYDLKVYGPMTVRSYLMAFTPINVEKADSIKRFAYEYQQLFFKLNGVEADGRDFNGSVLFPVAFLHAHFDEATRRVQQDLFTKEFL